MYNFDPALSGNFIGHFKICSFKNGDIVTKDVLKAGMGTEKYQELIEGIGLDKMEPGESFFEKYQMFGNNGNNELSQSEMEMNEQNFDFSVNRAEQRQAKIESIQLKQA